MPPPGRRAPPLGLLLALTALRCPGNAPPGPPPRPPPRPRAQSWLRRGAASSLPPSLSLCAGHSPPPDLGGGQTLGTRGSPPLPPARTPFPGARAPPPPSSLAGVLGERGALGASGGAPPPGIQPPPRPAPPWGAPSTPQTPPRCWLSRGFAAAGVGAPPLSLWVPHAAARRPASSPDTRHFRSPLPARSGASPAPPHAPRLSGTPSPPSAAWLRVPPAHTRTPPISGLSRRHRASGRSRAPPAAARGAWESRVPRALSASPPEFGDPAARAPCRFPGGSRCCFSSAGPSLPPTASRGTGEPGRSRGTGAQPPAGFARARGES